MNFYLESITNDIDIAELEYNIESDKLDLIINYYSNTDILYKESTEEFTIESGGKVKNAIKNISKAVIAFINKCIDTVRNLTTTNKIEKLKKDYKKAIEHDPSLKDVKIEYNDVTEDVEMMNKHLVTIKGKLKNADVMDDEINDYKKKLENKKKVIKTITIGSAITLVTTLSARFFKHSKERKKLIEEIEKACDIPYDTPRFTKIVKSELKIDESDDDTSKKQLKILLDRRTKYKNAIDINRIGVNNFKTNLSNQNFIKYICDTIKKSSKTELSAVLDLVKHCKEILYDTENDIIDLGEAIKNKNK